MLLLVLHAACTPDGESAVDARFVGAEPGDYAGTSVAGAGDLNGDGHDDILVGATGNKDAGIDDDGNGAGAAYVVLGGATLESRSLASADVVLRGTTGGARVGRDLTGVGDFDGDGFDDILVADQTTAVASAAAYLIRGGPSVASRSLADADATFTGATSANVRVDSIAGAGDVTADGYDDILLLGSGHLNDEDNLGPAAYLIFGDPEPTSRTLAAADVEMGGDEYLTSFNPSVAGAGDVGGDGLDDVLIGVGGAVYIAFGGPDMQADSFESLDVILTPENWRDEAGASVAGAGDVNGDGYADSLIGAPWNRAGGYLAGAAYIVLGGPELASKNLEEADAKLEGEGAETVAGDAIAGAGDVDADGYDDVLIGGPGYTNAVYLLRGGTLLTSGRLTESDRVATGPGSVGSSLAGGGDVNGDGRVDLLFGAPDVADEAGAAFVLLGG